MNEYNDNSFFTDCLINSFLILLKEKKYEELSVSELCKKAGISRMTFYRTYHSKEEVFYRYIDRLVEDYKIEITHDKGFASYIRLEYIELIFAYFRKYSEVVKCMVENHIDDYLRKKFIRTELNLTLDSDVDNNSRYTAIAYANALYGLLTDWICSGMTENPIVPATVLYNIFSGQIKRY